MCKSRFITVFVIAIWLLTPDVLCLIPGATHTMDEHECCKLMGGECGMAPMPDIHKCCRNVSQFSVVISAKATDYPEPRLAIAPLALPGFDAAPEAAPPWEWAKSASASPPLLHSRESIDILRI